MNRACAHRAQLRLTTVTRNAPLLPCIAHPRPREERAPPSEESSARKITRPPQAFTRSSLPPPPRATRAVQRGQRSSSIARTRVRSRRNTDSQPSRSSMRSIPPVAPRGSRLNLLSEPRNSTRAHNWARRESRCSCSTFLPTHTFAPRRHIFRRQGRMPRSLQPRPGFRYRRWCPPCSHPQIYPMSRPARSLPQCHRRPPLSRRARSRPVCHLHRFPCSKRSSCRKGQKLR